MWMAPALSKLTPMPVPVGLVTCASTFCTGSAGVLTLLSDTVPLSVLGCGCNSMPRLGGDDRATFVLLLLVKKPVAAADTSPVVNLNDDAVASVYVPPGLEV